MDEHEVIIMDKQELFELLVHAMQSARDANADDLDIEMMAEHLATQLDQ